MGKYIGSSCRLCRREGEKLFLKGTRCSTHRCAFERRAYAPGRLCAREVRELESIPGWSWPAGPWMPHWSTSRYQWEPWPCASGSRREGGGSPAPLRGEKASLEEWHGHRRASKPRPAAGPARLRDLCARVCRNMPTGALEHQEWDFLLCDHGVPRFSASSAGDAEGEERRFPLHCRLGDRR